MIPVLILLGVIVVLVLWFVGAYNGLVNARNQVKNAWAQIDVQLKRRHDLIPNLTETVKGYMQHERGTLEAVTNARNTAIKAADSGVAAANVTQTIAHGTSAMGTGAISSGACATWINSSNRVCPCHHPPWS